jgi:hypothetical protein
MYKILCSITISDLENLIMAYMCKGYKPAGGVTYYEYKKQGYWMQAVFV